MHVDSSYDNIHEVHDAVNDLPFLAESLSSVSLSLSLCAVPCFFVRSPAHTYTYIV